MLESRVKEERESADQICRSLQYLRKTVIELLFSSFSIVFSTQHHHYGNSKKLRNCPIYPLGGERGGGESVLFNVRLRGTLAMSDTVTHTPTPGPQVPPSMGETFASFCC